jgi:NADH:ubiquinone oxidoreductase subunit
MIHLKKLTTSLYLKIFGELTHVDEYGNHYYQTKKQDTLGRHKRYCIYRGISEASKIPAAMHLWMHHQTENPVNKNKKYFWQKAHIPNLTGTQYSFTPRKKSIAFEEKNASKQTPKHYTPWNPNE